VKAVLSRNSKTQKVAAGSDLTQYTPKLVDLSAYKANSDPVADIYKRIRDAAFYSDNVPCGLRIAVLEMVKAELVALLQAEIDEGE